MFHLLFGAMAITFGVFAALAILANFKAVMKVVGWGFVVLLIAIFTIIGSLRH